MWDRLLLAMDQFEAGQTALHFTAGLASATGSEVRVLHVRELARSTRIPPLETPAEAAALVDEAVHSLHDVGIGAGGRAVAARADLVADTIVDEAARESCDVIVLGSRRLRGLHRLSAQGVREQVLRRSPLPVVAAPTPITDGLHRPAGHRSAWAPRGSSA